MHRSTKKYCNNCGVTHTPIMCFSKPRKSLKIKHDLTWDQTVAKWKLANPPNLNGNWVCYLQIAPLCPGKIDRHQLTLDHVIPKSRGKQYKYDYLNLRACCVYCNSLKGSRTLESLAHEYPHLEALLAD